MKTLTMRIAFSALLSVTLLSCHEDPIVNEQGATSVRFQVANTEVEEGGAEGTVIVELSRPASADATFSLKAGDGFENVLNTTPPIENGLIKLAIQKGDISAALKLQPIDNAASTGNKILELTLHSVAPPFAIGTGKSLSIIVKDDENITAQAVANFIHQEITLEETNTSGVEYLIHLSEALTFDATIKISLLSQNARYSSDYVTEPAAENDTITLALGTGQKVVGFRVTPVSNGVITGELAVKFSIAETGGLIVKGQNAEQTLAIKDKELAGKPKGFEITAGNTVVKQFYEYDSQGRIAKVNWQNYTPYRTAGTDTYFYDANNNVERINKHPYKDIRFYWNNGRAVKSEEVSGGVVQSYSEYEYDEAGNVGGVVSYHRQENGEFLKGFFTVYLYYFDGNLYKSLTYHDSNDPEEPTLVRTRTYENYIDVPNPFPMTEVVPGVRVQTKLATRYRVEENEQDLTYDMVYEYLPDGLPAKRIASAPGDTQTAAYHYY